MALARRGLKRCTDLTRRFYPDSTFYKRIQLRESPKEAILSLHGSSPLQFRHFATSVNRDQPVIVPNEQPQPVNWSARKAAVVIGTGIGIVLAAFSYFQRPPIEAKSTNIPTKPVKVTVGGPFKLQNQDGKVITNEDFLGKWSLVYFGYTHCPEDCPRQLQKIAEVVKRLEASGNPVVPIIITTDPERDNPAQLKQYLKEFCPKYVGLTGEPSEVRPVLWKFRVFFRKTDEEGLDYLVEHSSNVYLMNTNMECVKVFGPEYHASALTEAIEKEMKRIDGEVVYSCSFDTNKHLRVRCSLVPKVFESKFITSGSDVAFNFELNGVARYYPNLV